MYTIGAGITGYAPVPVQLRDGRVALRRADVEIDERTLEDSAERTGGRYFHATDAEGLAAVVEEIDQLERSEITEVRYLEYEYHYAAFVIAALVMIGVAGVAAGSFLRRLP